MSDLLNIFHIIDLSPGGRPLLKENEIEIKWYDEVNIQTITTQRKEDLFLSKILSLLLTNLSLIILLPIQLQRVCAWVLELKEIQKIEDCATRFKSSKRIKIHLKDERIFEIKFLNGNKEGMIELINKTLQRKSWEQMNSQVVKVEETQFSVKSAGIGGLIRRQEREHQTLETVRNEAFTDLEALIDRAKDIVQVIDKYAHGRFDKGGTGVGDDQSDTSSEIGDASVLEGILLNIGQLFHLPFSYSSPSYLTVGTSL